MSNGGPPPPFYPAYGYYPGPYQQPPIPQQPQYTYYPANIRPVMVPSMAPIQQPIPVQSVPQTTTPITPRVKKPLLIIDPTTKSVVVPTPATATGASPASAVTTSSAAAVAAGASAPVSTLTAAANAAPFVPSINAPAFAPTAAEFVPAAAATTVTSPKTPARTNDEYKSATTSTSTSTTAAPAAATPPSVRSLPFNTVSPQSSAAAAAAAAAAPASSQASSAASTIPTATDTTANVDVDAVDGDLDDIPDQAGDDEADEDVPEQVKYPPGNFCPLTDPSSAKKYYTKDFLLLFRHLKKLTEKPANIADLGEIIKPQVDLTRMPARPRNVVPNYMRGVQLTARRNSSTSSARGGKGRGGKGRNQVQQPLLTPDQVRPLEKSENAWVKPEVKLAQLSEEEAELEKLKLTVRGILNKITPTTKDKLSDQILKLDIKTSERLVAVLHLTFDKAIDEPNFAVLYASLCEKLSNLEVADTEEGVGKQTTNFRRSLLNRCQEEFEKEQRLPAEPAPEELAKMTQAEREQVEETRLKYKRRMIGNIIFIGELYKLSMLTRTIMQHCIKYLQRAGDEESLECMCKLLTTIGLKMESQSQDTTDMDQYFKSIQQILAQREQTLSSRIRFMLQDLIDTRNNKWVPRRHTSGPKKVDEIRADETKRQQEEQRQSQHSHRSGSTSGGGYHKDGRGGGGGSNNQQAKAVQQVSKSKLNSLKEKTHARNLNSNQNQPSFAPQKGTFTTVTGTGARPPMNPTAISKPAQTANAFSALEMEDEAPSSPAPGAAEDAVEEEQADEAPSAEEVEKKIDELVKEYMNARDVKDALECIKDIPTEAHRDLVQAFLNVCVNANKDADVDAVCTLLHTARSSNILNEDAEFAAILALAADIADIQIDCPQAFTHYGHALGSLLPTDGVILFLNEFLQKIDSASGQIVTKRAALRQVQKKNKDDAVRCAKALNLENLDSFLAEQDKH